MALSFVRTPASVYFNDEFARANGNLAGSDYSVPGGYSAVVSAQRALLTGRGLNDFVRIDGAAALASNALAVAGAVEVYCQALVCKHDSGAEVAIALPGGKGVPFLFQFYNGFLNVYDVSSGFSSIGSSVAVTLTTGQFYIVHLYAKAGQQTAWVENVQKFTAANAASAYVGANPSFRSTISGAAMEVEYVRLRTSKSLPFTGLPSGSSVRAKNGAGTVVSGPVAAVAGAATLDLGGVTFPVPTIEVINGSGAVIGTYSAGDACPGDSIAVSGHVDPNAPTVSISSIGNTFASLTGSAFSSDDGAATHAASQFRVRRLSDSVVLYGPTTVSTGSLVGPHTATGLPEGSTGLVGEARYQDQFGTWSAWGTSSSFSVIGLSAPTAPTLTPVAGIIAATINGSAFSDADVGETHAATQWQVTLSADTTFAAPFYNSGPSGEGAPHLTSLALTGLSAATAYRARARYKDSGGIWSNWSTAATWTQLTLTYTGEYRAADSVSAWTTLFSGVTTLSFDWEWFDSDVPPGDYDLRVKAIEDGVAGPYSATVRFTLTSGRVFDEATIALYESGEFDLHSRVHVENGSSTLINLFGRYVSCQQTYPSPANPIGSLLVTFLRETSSDGANSLAPMIQGSALNKLDDGVTYSPLLQVGRLVVRYVALTAQYGTRPADEDERWYEVFRGAVRNVSWPQRFTPNAAIQCYDLGGVLNKSKSEDAYTYPSGTAYEDAAQLVLDNNGHDSVVLHVPVPTGEVLESNYGPGVQKTTWEQITALAQSIGLLAMFRYIGRSTLVLSFFEAATTKTVADLVLLYHDFTALDIDEESIGNVLFGIFSDSTGERKRIGPFENEASIEQYGGSLGIRRANWVVLEPDSPVRTTAAFTALLAKVLAEIADPDVTATALSVPLVFADVGIDLYALEADPRFFDVDQTLAPVSVVVNERVDEEPTSSIELRGMPSAGLGVLRTSGNVTSEAVIYGVTVEHSPVGFASLSLVVSARVLWWEVLSQLGTSPKVDGELDYGASKGEFNGEVTNATWSVVDGTHEIVVRAHGEGGKFVDATVSLEVTGAGSGGGGGGGVAPTEVPTELFTYADPVAVANFTWENTNTTSQIEVAVYVNASFSYSIVADAETVEHHDVFSNGTKVKFKARYTNGTGLEGPWSAFSNQITMSGIA